MTLAFKIDIPGTPETLLKEGAVGLQLAAKAGLKNSGIIPTKELEQAYSIHQKDGLPPQRSIVFAGIWAYRAMRILFTGDPMKGLEKFAKFEYI